MAELERKYIIPLRREWLKVPTYKRAKKAVTATKQFLQKHMKTEDVRLGKYLNKALWARGMKKPPHKIEVLAKKVEQKDKSYVFAELPNAPKEEAKKETRKKSKITEKVKEALKAPEDKEEKSEKAKALKKEEEHKAEATKTPAAKEKAEAKKDHKKEIISHTGKPKTGVETTGRH